MSSFLDGLTVQNEGLEHGAAPRILAELILLMNQMKKLVRIMNDVIRLIPPNDIQDKTRSRQNSYADLQRLRMNSTSASATHPLKSDDKSPNTIDMYHQLDQPEESSQLLHRPRRSTLSDASNPTMALVMMRRSL